MEKKMKKSIIFLILLNVFVIQIAFSQKMNVFTKTGVTTINLSDIDSINFTTAILMQLPVLTTSAVSAISKTSAYSGGNITSDGGTTVTARGVCWGSDSTITIANSKTIDSSGSGSFTSKITGLTSNTTYYVRAYATNSLGTAYGNPVSFKTLLAEGTVADKDGNIYNYITIGTQVWMIENLKTTKYRNGDSLLNMTSDGTWNNTTIGGYCNYNNNSTNATDYGKLYNWYAVNDSRGLAPTGWHIPSDAEWATLITYLGGENVAGGKLKETGLLHWLTPNQGATNETGFSAFPGGFREINGVYSDLGSFGNWWSSTEINTLYAYYRHMYYNYGGIGRVYANKKTGFSVRCIKD
jgi:uncharacterized protein (TIGR02145 family)